MSTDTNANRIAQNKILSLFDFLFLCFVPSFLFNPYCSPPVFLRFPVCAFSPFLLRLPATCGKNHVPTDSLSSPKERRNFPNRDLFYGGTSQDGVCGSYRSVSAFRISVFVNFGFYVLCEFENEVSLPPLIVGFYILNDREFTLVNPVMVPWQVPFHFFKPYVLSYERIGHPQIFLSPVPFFRVLCKTGRSLSALVPDSR